MTVGNTADFSVLLPVYSGDSPAFLQRSLRSVTFDQTLRPAQVVIVVDGSIGAELNQALSAGAEAIIAELGLDVVVQRLDVNSGLSVALNEGLKRCRFDVVARQDADDISLPNRFELQWPAFSQQHSVLGASLAEFDADESAWISVRRFPSDAAGLRRAAKSLCPINHPTVMYRKSDVQAVGGYVPNQKAEDYWLWSRMLMAGMHIENLSDVIVLYRVGAGSYERRGGVGMLASDWEMQRRFLSSGFISFPYFVKNMMIRAVYRLTPVRLRKLAYRRMVQ